MAMVFELKRSKIIRSITTLFSGSVVAQGMTTLALLFTARQLNVDGYGQYAALRGLSYLGRGPIRNIVTDYQRGVSWSEMAQNNGSRINELTTWIGNITRTTIAVGRQLRTQPYGSSPRMP